MQHGSCGKKFVVHPAFKEAKKPAGRKEQSWQDTEEK
jgi:hypothetical protein